MKRRAMGTKMKQLFTKRFFPAGNYTWTVPPGCTSVDVFIVGGGGSGSNSGGGGGYTKTFKKDTTGWRDGGAIAVTPGQRIPIIVGKGGVSASQGGSNSPGNNGGYSQFLDSNYRADGGFGGKPGQYAGSGGSAGSGDGCGNGASDGNGTSNRNVSGTTTIIDVPGQGHTTKDFGESTGKRNAGGGSGESGSTSQSGGVADYSEGKGSDATSWHDNYHGRGGGGYGGGGGGARGWNVNSGAGGDGTVLIRYYAYSAE